MQQDYTSNLALLTLKYEAALGLLIHPPQKGTTSSWQSLLMESGKKLKQASLLKNQNAILLT